MDESCNFESKVDIEQIVYPQIGNMSSVFSIDFKVYHLPSLSIKNIPLCYNPTQLFLL